MTRTEDHHDARTTRTLLESLERALGEVEALREIYDTDFTIHSSGGCLRRAQAAVENGALTVKQHDDDDDDACTGAIRLDVSLDVSLCEEGDEDPSSTIRLCGGLPR